MVAVVGVVAVIATWAMAWNRGGPGRFTDDDAADPGHAIIRADAATPASARRRLTAAPNGPAMWDLLARPPVPAIGLSPRHGPRAAPEQSARRDALGYARMDWAELRETP